MEYIIALIFPFILLLIEIFFPYPYLIEELFKFYLAKKAETTKIAIILGVFFSFSEAIFYFLNPIYFLDIGLSFLRFAVVTAMHITTILVMRYFARKDNLWPIGLLLAFTIHYIFNIQSI